MLQMQATDTLQLEKFDNYTKITKVPATIMKVILCQLKINFINLPFLWETMSSNVRSAILILTNV